ncbi:MAG: hypothetical protein LBM00_09845 [Deltaproteobacteria bacterium]|jgi:hypothetical protein|nr:hypothetical protein [Deltaproteobacteria bacterium]
MNEYDNFMNSILKIENQLNILYGKSEYLVDDLINNIEKLNFIDMDIIINRYENLMIAITHEIRSEIGFFRDDIDKLNKYIHFRIKYNNFTDDILENIVDTELTLTDKKEIFRKNDNKEIIKTIKEIKQDWNRTFENKGYKKIKVEIKLNEI